MKDKEWSWDDIEAAFLELELDGEKSGYAIAYICPSCKCDLKGYPMPEVLVEMIPEEPYDSKAIVSKVDRRGVIAEWKCPKCKFTWPAYNKEKERRREKLEAIFDAKMKQDKLRSK